MNRTARAVLATAVLTCVVLYQARDLGWIAQLVIVGILWFVLLLQLQAKGSAGGNARLPRRGDALGILFEAWRRRRRGASRPRFITGVDATPITPRSTFEREKECPACDARLPTVALLCPACGALVNPAWLMIPLAALVIVLGVFFWGLAQS